MAEATSTERLAQAFQTLVPEDQRERLLALAKDEASSASPLPIRSGFESAWKTLAQTLLTSYSDKPFVSDEYGRELVAPAKRRSTSNRSATIRPSACCAWLGTVAPSELRKLDLALVLDLLRIEDDDGPVDRADEAGRGADRGSAAGRRFRGGRRSRRSPGQRAPERRDTSRGSDRRHRRARRRPDDAPRRRTSGHHRRCAVRVREGSVSRAWRLDDPGRSPKRSSKRATRARASG